MAPTLLVVEEPGSPSGHVFVSYVREDSRYADLLQQVLESAGIRVWRDTSDLWPGEDWRAKIRHEIISNALVFVACFSRQSLAREVSYQNEELALAIEQMRLRRPDQPWLIPVRFDDCEIPDWQLGGGRTLATIQRADLFGDGGGDQIQRLVAAVRRILSRNAANLTLGGGLADQHGVAAPAPPSASGSQASGSEPASWVEKRQFSATRVLPGYDPDEVDRFLEAIRDTFLGIRQPPITPADVRNQRFTISRFRPGYAQREVDTFLAEAEQRLS